MRALLTPTRCAACGARAEPPWCPPCAAEAATSADGPLPDGWPPGAPIVGGTAAYRYEGPVRAAVVAAKARGAWSLWGPLGERLAAAVAAADDLDPDVVTWVAADARRVRARGLDHAAALAAPVAARLGVAWVRLLAARTGRPDQAALPARRRRELPDGAFRPVARVDGARVLLVDDVTTTGATVRAAARALRRVARRRSPSRCSRARGPMHRRAGDRPGQPIGAAPLGPPLKEPRVAPDDQCGRGRTGRNFRFVPSDRARLTELSARGPSPRPPRRNPTVADDRIRIVIADDHELFRRGLRMVLEDEADIEVVGEAGDGEEAVRLVSETVPDVVVMDVRMPALSGIEAAQQVKEELPHTKILMLTISDEEDDLYEAIKAGASGYLLKEISIDEIGSAVRSVQGGQSLISPSMASKLLNEFATMVKKEEEKQQVPAPRLTPREMEVLTHVAQGMNNREIAKALFISENTVKNHVRNILEKLHLHSRMEAVVYAVREKLLEIK